MQLTLAITVAGDGIGAVQDQPQPDAAKGQHMDGGERLAVHHYRQQKLQGRRQVLDQANS